MRVCVCACVCNVCLQKEGKSERYIVHFRTKVCDLWRKGSCPNSSENCFDYHGDQPQRRQPFASGKLFCRRHLCVRVRVHGCACVYMYVHVPSLPPPPFFFNFFSPMPHHFFFNFCVFWFMQLPLLPLFPSLSSSPPKKKRWQVVHLYAWEVQ